MRREFGECALNSTNAPRIRRMRREFGKCAVNSTNAPRIRRMRRRFDEFVTRTAISASPSRLQSMRG
jgi:hypothetical protein